MKNEMELFISYTLVRIEFHWLLSYVYIYIYIYNTENLADVIKDTTYEIVLLTCLQKRDTFIYSKTKSLGYL